MDKDQCDYNHEWEVVTFGSDMGKFRCKKCWILSCHRPDREQLVRWYGVKEGGDNGTF